MPIDRHELTRRLEDAQASIASAAKEIAEIRRLISHDGERPVAAFPMEGYALLSDSEVIGFSCA